jgi:hypothetical protein
MKFLIMVVSYFIWGSIALGCGYYLGIKHIRKEALSHGAATWYVTDDGWPTLEWKTYPQSKSTDEWRQPTDYEFREDFDFLELWFNEHGMSHLKPAPWEFVTNGKHVWRWIGEIKRPSIQRDRIKKELEKPALKVPFND